MSSHVALGATQLRFVIVRVLGDVCDVAATFFRMFGQHMVGKFKNRSGTWVRLIGFFGIPYTKYRAVVSELRYAHGITICYLNMVWTDWFRRPIKF